MNINLQQLPSEPSALQDIICTIYKEYSFLEQKDKDQTEEILKLTEQLKLLRAKLYSKSSEKVHRKKQDELQEEIADLELRIENIAAGDALNTNDPLRGQAKRQKLPAHLTREDEVINPDPNCPECGGEEFEKIGEDISETLEYKPASFRVKRNIRPRCRCKKCKKIVQAYPLSKAIDKGIAGPGLLAHVLVQKYCDHLPLYRQNQIFAREDVILPNSTLGGWVSSCAELLKPLAQQIKDFIFSTNEIHGDDSVVKVLDPGKGKTKTGRLWTYVRDGRPHGDLAPVAACYFYSPDRTAMHPEAHLKKYSGVMHADAYAAYNNLYIGSKNEKAIITEAGCWAHVRRKFHEVTLTTHKAIIANETIEQIGKLYDVETVIRGSPPEERLKLRQKKSKILAEEVFAFWEKAYDQLSKKSRTAKAIKYALNNKAALLKFLDDGRIEIDNNAAERAIRSIAVGRKNWLFVGSDKGGENAAVIYTIIETAKLNNVNPWKYLNKVLEIIQDYNSTKLGDLLPWNLALE